MPRRALKCAVDINLHGITCPGVYLPRRDDVYISICLMGQVRRTQLTCPIFPLVFHDRFNFDKVFYSAYEPSQVADSLEDEPVVIELIQLSDVYEGGKLLAYYETNARDFLYPYPSYTPTYGTQDRDILMERSLDFPGISPKLEFSTKTVIRETASPLVPDLDDDVLYTTRSTRKSRARTKSPVRKSIAYSRPTVSSITKGRSLSPSMRRRFEALDVEDRTTSRPPFVVRKLESRSLIGRDPGTPSPKQKVRCMHGTYGDPTNNKRKAMKTPTFCELCSVPLTEKNCTMCQIYRRYKGRPYWGHENNYHRHGHSVGSSSVKALSSYSDVDFYSDYGGSDLLDLTTSRPRYRSPSPVGTGAAARYWSPTRSEIIQARVDRALERNRIRDTYDPLYPYSSYRYRSDLATLDDLELDLELSRRRRRYLYY